MDATDAAVETFGPGVQFTAPPLEHLPSITAGIENALSALGPDDKAALVGITTDKGMNAAFLARGAKGWDVVLWIGKEWAAPGVGFGAGVIKRWQ